MDPRRHPAFGLPGIPPAACIAMRCRSRPRNRDEETSQGSTAMSTFVDRHRSDFDYNDSGSLGSFADILWRDHAGDTVLWLMNNNTLGTVVTPPFVPPDWH